MPELTFGAAVVLIVVIWAVVIAGLLVWFFVARSRRKQRAASALPPAPQYLRDQNATVPVEPLVAPAVRPTAPTSSAPAPPPSAPAPPPSVATTPNEPFGMTTMREYERLAAAPFEAPPAAALGDQPAPEPFSWSAATRDDPVPSVFEREAAERAAAERAAAAQLPPVDPEAYATTTAPPLGSVPAPRSAARRPTGITEQHVPVAPQAGLEDEFDRTVIVNRPPVFDWVLVLPQGKPVEIEPDSVIGRNPSSVDRAALVFIADPTRTLSKSHVRLRFVDGQWRVTDLASTNGVWLLHDDGREEQIEPHREVPSTLRLRLGTLDVELQRRADA